MVGSREGGVDWEEEYNGVYYTTRFSQHLNTERVGGVTRNHAVTAESKRYRLSMDVTTGLEVSKQN